MIWKQEYPENLRSAYFTLSNIISPLFARSESEDETDSDATDEEEDASDDNDDDEDDVSEEER